jgi:hypothetical protein
MRDGSCTKCGSRKIGYLERVVHRTEATVSGTAVRGHATAPVGVGSSTSGSFIKVITNFPIGEFEAFVCGDCGAFETYVKNPNDVPWDQIHGFRWIGQE